MSHRTDYNARIPAGMKALERLHRGTLGGSQN
jgi:hypothetical protein